MIHPIRKLAREIHRRSVWQVLGAYAVWSWLVLSVVTFFANTVGLPLWTHTMALILLALGLPGVLATAVVQGGLPGLRIRDIEDPALMEVRTPEHVLVLPEPHPLDHLRLLTWRNAVLGGVTSAVLLMGSVVAYLAMWSLGIGPVGSLVAQGLIGVRDPVVVAPFEARTADATLGRAVTDGLTLDLGLSSIVTVVGVGSSVARTEPRALIRGDISPNGDGFRVTARIVESPGGSVLAEFDETADDERELLELIDRLAERLREKFGESLKTIRGGAAVEGVLPQSLDALRRYGTAERASAEGDGPRSIGLLRDALDLDPGFAMAWWKLCVAYLAVTPDAPAQVEAAIRAYELRERLPRKERLLAEAHYHEGVVGNGELAVRLYQEALDLDPDNAMAVERIRALRGLVAGDPDSPP